jgi:hypothetical protein
VSSSSTSAAFADHVGGPPTQIIDRALRTPGQARSSTALEYGNATTAGGCVSPLSDPICPSDLK